jgi:hypothetical protein
VQPPVVRFNPFPAVLDGPVSICQGFSLSQRGRWSTDRDCCGVPHIAGKMTSCAQLWYPFASPGRLRADTASVAATTPKDRRLLQIGSLISIAAVFMALGGGFVGTHRPLGIALLVLGIVILQASWIPAIRRRTESMK